MTIKGGCLCGQVRYSIGADPLYAGFCHCRDCMKATGSGFGAFMGFRPGDVTMTGDTKRFTKIGGSGEPTARYFCTTCGSTVYGDGGEANPGREMTIYAGTLDDPELFRPQAAIFTHSRPSWARVMGDIPQYEGMVPH
jgi:hypothetical protein